MQMLMVASKICAGKIKDYQAAFKRKDFKGPKRAMGGRIWFLN